MAARWRSTSASKSASKKASTNQHEWARRRLNIFFVPIRVDSWTGFLTLHDHQSGRPADRRQLLRQRPAAALQEDLPPVQERRVAAEEFTPGRIMAAEEEQAIVHFRQRLLQLPHLGHAGVELLLEF